MAEDKSLSTLDLFLLMVGLYKLTDPQPTDKTSAEKYWLKAKNTLHDKDTLRDAEWNWMWLLSPEAAWESVLYRDWLIAKIAANLAGHSQDFSALSEPMRVSMDLLSKEFKPRMAGATDAIKQLLVSKSGYERSFLTALSIGLSQQKSGGQDVNVLGAGIRRRTGVWNKDRDDRTALRADIEFFAPFYVIPGTGQSENDSFLGARSICAGLALTRANGNPIIEEEDWKEIAAVRFNFRIPFTARKSQKPKRDDYELETRFEPPPVIEAQKRKYVFSGSKQPDWEKFDNWKDFVKAFCGTTDGKELLSAPIGPILLETMSDPSGLKDILKSKRTQIKEDFLQAKDELKETATLLHGLWKDWTVPEENPEPETVTPHSSERKLGGLLESLGLLDGKGGKYTFKGLGDLTVWHVLNNLLSELDGFPLYVSGVEPTKEKSTSIVVALASQAAELDPLKHFFGLAGLVCNIPIKTVSDEAPTKDEDANATKLVLNEKSFITDNTILIHDDEDEEEEEEVGTPPIIEEETDKPKKKSTVEIRLHLGKWFDGETLEDNWFRRLLPEAKITDKTPWKRRTPLPGIRLLPLQRMDTTDHQKADYSLALRGDLLSAGFDFTGTTKDGLTFLNFNNGPLAYFGLGAIETRIALLLSVDRVAFGIGIKLKDLRLSFGPKEKKKEGEKEEKKDSGDDILAGLQDLLADDWVVVPPTEKPAEKTPKTRLSAKKKDKFSISVGYLSPLSSGSHGTLDIQLYDEKGKRSSMVWIPIERRYRAVYLKHIGIGLKGVENLELSKGLSESAQLSIALTGGLRFPIFELGFIGAKFTFPLTNPRNGQFSLDGLDVSLKLGAAVVSGSFLRSGVEYAGSLTIDLPKISIGAMGFYGNLAVFSMSSDKNMVAGLKVGLLHPTLLKELAQNSIRPALSNPLRPSLAVGEWELLADDNQRYIIAEADGELHVLSQDKTFFIYGTVSAATGGGLRIGPIEFTGIALGFGINRRVEVPAIEDVAEFPLVKMVMGEGGYQEEDKSGDLRNQLGEAIKDPVEVLETMAESLPAERDQYFICGGVRFTIATMVDCFGLIIVQWGNDFEFSLLGLARFKYPRDVSAKALCYIEMQLLMTIKPSEGTFKLQAQLTSNSWIINKDCKVTGGFALYVWFDGEHKDDFVITLGGYHPRFQKPDHYPLVPRLGLNWPVNKNLTIKGGVYYAITPSCFMLGAKLEATFHSGRVSAWFTAYLDVVIAWSPFHYEVDLGISLRVEATLFVTAIKVTIAATLQMWGPPTGGIAHVDLTVISFDVPFGTPREEAKPQLTESWEKFCRTFLNGSGTEKKAGDKPVPAFQITKPNLAAGRFNLNQVPITGQEAKQRENGPWKVRGDELELAASTAVPVTVLNVGYVKTKNQLEGIQERSFSGQSLLVSKPIVFDETKKLHAKDFSGALGVHPMGKKLKSALNVTLVRDAPSGTVAVDLSEWTIEQETNSLPAALWDAAKPDPKGPSEPTAKLIPNCITGIKRLKPQAGKRGQQAALSEMTWKDLDHAKVPKPGASQEFPSKTRSRNIQAAVAGKQADQKQVVDALAVVGFKLAWQPKTEIRFRELQADPLAGAVATK